MTRSLLTRFFIGLGARSAQPFGNENVQSESRSYSYSPRRQANNAFPSLTAGSPQILHGLNGLRGRTRDGESYFCLMEKEDRDPHLPSQLPGWWCDSLEGKLSTLKGKSILSSGGCQIRAGVAAIPQGYFPASHFLATRPDFTKKGTSAGSRNPFVYYDGAEGGI